MQNLASKVLLLIDNGPEHSSGLIEANPNVEVDYIITISTGCSRSVADFKAYYTRHNLKQTLNI